MASGDLTASTPVTVSGTTGTIKTQIDLLNLAAATDTVHIIPIDGRDNTYVIFKVEREA
jgi:hypothetical protein